MEYKEQLGEKKIPMRNNANKARNDKKRRWEMTRRERKDFKEGKRKLFGKIEVR